MTPYARVFGVGVCRIQDLEIVFCLLRESKKMSGRADPANPTERGCGMFWGQHVELDSAATSVLSSSRKADLSLESSVRRSGRRKFELKPTQLLCGFKGLVISAVQTLATYDDDDHIYCLLSLRSRTNAHHNVSFC